MWNHFSCLIHCQIPDNVISRLVFKMKNWYWVKNATNFVVWQDTSRVRLKKMYRDLLELILDWHLKHVLHKEFQVECFYLSVVKEHFGETRWTISTEDNTLLNIPFSKVSLLWCSVFVLQSNGSPGVESCPTPPPTAEKSKMAVSFCFCFSASSKSRKSLHWFLPGP